MTVKKMNPRYTHEQKMAFVKEYLDDSNKDGILNFGLKRGIPHSTLGTWIAVYKRQNNIPVINQKRKGGRKLKPDIIPVIADMYFNKKMTVVDISKKYNISQSCLYKNINKYAHYKKKVPLNQGYTPEFKFSVALRSLNDNESQRKIAQEEKISQGTVSLWSRVLKENGHTLFLRDHEKISSPQPEQKTDNSFESSYIALGMLSLAASAFIYYLLTTPS